MSETPTPPFGNPNLNTDIPDMTLPKVGFPTPRPYHIEVGVSDDYGGEEPRHPWYVIESSTEDSGDGVWGVKGGKVFDHIVTPTLPIEVEDTTVVWTEEGVIYLKIERELSSREVVAATIEVSDTLPADDYTFQHFALANINTNIEVLDSEDFEPIVQVRFEDIRVFEMLIVANGEFRFGNFQMMGEMNYELPE